MESTKNWKEINEFFDDTNYIELAQNLSHSNLAKFEEAYVASICWDNFKDTNTLDAAMGLSQKLSATNYKLHSRNWYLDRLSELINAGWEVDILKKRPDDELVHMVNNTKLYIENADRFIGYAKENDRKAELEKELGRERQWGV